jgi:AraC family transcriptional activator of pobA
MEQRYGSMEELSEAPSNGRLGERALRSSSFFADSRSFIRVSAMRPRKIPTYPLADYSGGMTRGSDIFVGTFEGSVKQRPNRLAIHRHDYFELFLLDGKGQHFNDFETYPIEVPSIVCVSPGQVHFWRGALHGPMICFTQEFVEKYSAPGYSLVHHPFWFPAGAPPIMSLSRESAAETRSLIEEIGREFVSQGADSEQVLRLLLQALLFRIARSYPPQDAEPGMHREARLHRAFLVALEQNFRTVTSVSSYAKLLRVTPETLSDAVKQRTGKTAGTLIRHRVLLEAQRLLLHTSMTVAEIAYSLKFEDPSYFNRFFRRLTGKTPTDFRSQVSSELLG